MLTAVVNKFNRGEVSSLALAREDVAKVQNSGSLMTNFVPMRLGPMIYRPGTEHLGSVNEAFMVPFIAATDDTAILEFTNNQLRVWVDDALVGRTSVTSTVTNGTFTSDITGWTDDSGAGSTTAWQTGGYASLTGADTTKAVLYQTISNTETDVEHGLTVVVLQAPVQIKIGTGGNGSDDLYSGTLDPGTHSLVFTPDSNFTITFSNSAEYETLIDSVALDTTGTLAFTTDVATADLSSLRYTQSADVVYFARNGNPLFKIERRGVKSWSIADYRVDDGPFETINNTEITLTPGALDGDTTLTASDSFFKSTHVGALFKLASLGQEVDAAVSAAGNGTGSIRVTGIGDARKFTISRSGTWVATVTLQRSIDDSTWEDVETYTANGVKTYDDNLDNSILYYRLYVKAGEWTSGTVNLNLTYASGSIEGICRVTAYTSATVVDVQVLTSFGATDATRDWYEGSWSDKRGHPSATDLYEGRLWFAGDNQVWGSVSDAYTSFDRGIEGDSASIQKTIGFGPVDTVHWLAASNRLLMGVASDEIAIRSSSFGEVLTPENTNLKAGSNKGVAPIEPLKKDGSVFFVQRSGIKIYALNYRLDKDEHSAGDITVLNPEICEAGIKRMAFTQEPDQRIYVVLDDGTARVYLTDPTEDVAAWSRIETDGDIEDVIVLPGLKEDRVYFVVNRTGGRYFEKLSLYSEAKAGNLSKVFDSSLTLTSPGTTITVSHIANGSTVGVWADGQDRGDFTVTAGQITVPSSWTNVCVGLRYTADYVTNKIAGFVPGSVLSRRKRIVDTGLVLKDYRPGALTIGPSIADLKALPGIEDGKAVVTTTNIDNYDEIPFEYDGEDEADPRIYLRCIGPCTVMALTYGVKDPTNSARNQE
jgi:hypothetical protein